MARQKGAIPTKPLTVHLPVDVLSKLQLHLFSEVEGRVPHGAYAKLLVGLVEAYLAELERTQIVEAEEFKAFTTSVLSQVNLKLST